MSYSMMDDEKLLLLVQKYEYIYNKRHPLYRFVSRKRQAWIEIARELGTDDETCIRRFTTLRDRYVKEKRKENSSSGGGNENRVPWAMSEFMEFLDPHITARRFRSNGLSVSWLNKEPTSLNQSATSSSIDPLHWNNVTSDQDDCEDTMLDMQYELPAETKTPQPSPSVPIKRNAIEPAYNDSTDVDDAFCDALRSFKKLCQTREERKGNEALHGFGQMIIATIAGMSTLKQTKAMLRVTEVVMQIKLEPDD